MENPEHRAISIGLPMEEKVIEFVSKKLASGKRIHELEMLNRLLKYQHVIMAQLEKSLHENYNCWAVCM